ncbi:myosuppressin [Orussus abietinus]|uniref:myosuppressin n=1 Tax=Orussus abietinus TaxID=222816 RepID=UPI000625C16D|nr:myosuppressin [Orussus abietinus]
MKCNTAMASMAFATILLVLSGHCYAMPPAQCSSGVLEEIPPRIRKVCAALSTMYELSAAMENYIEDKVPVLRENIPLPESAVKRQDVDHVFLRFGRRR